jgi:hypothetical protein
MHTIRSTSIYNIFKSRVKTMMFTRSGTNVTTVKFLENTYWRRQEGVKIQLKLCLCGVVCYTKSLIAEFQLIFKLTLDELQVMFTSCLDVKKERNSDGRMTLSKEKLQRTHSIRTTEIAAIHRLSE